MTSPRAAASPPAVRDAALRLVRALGLPAGTPALDVPCGTGLLLADLAALGFRPRGGDRDPAPARAAGLAADALDLEARLPYADGAFGLVTCVEGIEHVEAQRPLLAEVARVLAPGGALVLTTPNVLGRPSRTSLARHGYARFFRPTPPGSATPFEHEHVHPIDAVRLEHLLLAVGLVPQAWDGDHGAGVCTSWRRRLLYRLEAGRLRRHNPRADLLTLPAVYHSRVVAVAARKPG